LASNERALAIAARERAALGGVNAPIHSDTACIHDEVAVLHDATARLFDYGDRERQ
jgi:hypothetical protein